jgi:hypothetical protein
VESAAPEIPEEPHERRMILDAPESDRGGCSRRSRLLALMARLALATARWRRSWSRSDSIGPTDE